MGESSSQNVITLTGLVTMDAVIMRSYWGRNLPRELK